MLGGGSASIAFAVLTFLNIVFIVASKIVCGKNVVKNYVVLQSLSHVATFCIVLLGSIVVVMVCVCLSVRLLILTSLSWLFSLNYRQNPKTGLVLYSWWSRFLMVRFLKVLTSQDHFKDH